MRRGANARQSGRTAAGRPRCEERTKRGTRCAAFALPGERYCWSHHPERQGEVREARSKGATVKNQLVAIEGKRKRLDSAEALTRFTADVVQDVLGGAVTPDVGRCVLYGTSVLRSLIETGDIERRLAALEQGTADEKGAPRWHA